MAEAELDLRVNPQQGIQGLKQFDSGLERTAHTVSSFRETLEDTFNFGGLAALGFGTMSGYAMKNFGKNIIKMAGDAQEAQGKFSAVMGVMAADARKLGNDLAKSYNFSKSVANEAIASMVDQMRKGGASMKQALSWTDELSKRAADIQAFANVDDVGRVMEAFKAAMTGENERLKAFGIVVNQATIKYQMMKEAKQGIIYATEREAKMGATQALILQQSAAAAGQVAREADNLGNRERALESRWHDLQESMGNAFIPVATKVTDKMAKIAEAFDKWNPKAKSATVWTAAIVAGLVGVGIPLTKAFIGMRNYFNISKLARAATLGNAAATATEQAAVEAETGAVTANSAAETQNGTAVTALTSRKTAETTARLANVQALEAELVALQAQNTLMNQSAVASLGDNVSRTQHAARQGSAVASLGNNALNVAEIAEAVASRTQHAARQGSAVASAGRTVSNIAQGAVSLRGGALAPVTRAGSIFTRLGGVFTKILPAVTRLIPHLLKFAGGIGAVVGVVVTGIQIAKKLPDLVDKFFTGIGPKLIEAVKHPFKTTAKIMKAGAKAAWTGVTKVCSWGFGHLSKAANGLAEGFGRAVRWITDRAGMLEELDKKYRMEKQVEAHKKADEAEKNAIANKKVADDALGAADYAQRTIVGNAYAEVSGQNEIDSVQYDIDTQNKLLNGDGKGNKGYVQQQKEEAELNKKLNDNLVALTKETEKAWKEGGFDEYQNAEHAQNRKTAFDNAYEAKMEAMSKNITTDSEENNKDFEAIKAELMKTEDASQVKDVENIDQLMAMLPKLAIRNDSEFVERLEKNKSKSDNIKDQQEVQRIIKEKYDEGKFSEVNDYLQNEYTLKKNIDKDTGELISYGGLVKLDDQMKANGNGDLTSIQGQIANSSLRLQELGSNIGNAAEALQAAKAEGIKNEQTREKARKEQRIRRREEDDEQAERVYNQGMEDLSIQGSQARSFVEQERVRNEKRDLNQKRIEELSTDENGNQIDLQEQEEYWLQQKRNAENRGLNAEFSYQDAKGNTITTSMSDIASTFGENNREFWGTSDQATKQETILNAVQGLKSVGVDKFTDKSGQEIDLSTEAIKNMTSDELDNVRAVIFEATNKAMSESEMDADYASSQYNMIKSKNDEVRKLENENKEEEYNSTQSRIGLDEDQRKRNQEQTERNRSVYQRNRERTNSLTNADFERRQKQSDRAFARMSAQTGQSNVLAQLSNQAAITSDQFAFNQNQYQSEIGALTNEQNENQKSLTALKRQGIIDMKSLSETDQNTYYEEQQKLDQADYKIKMYNEKKENGEQLTDQEQADLRKAEKQKAKSNEALDSIASRAEVDFSKMTDVQKSQYEDLHSKQMSLDDELFEKKSAMQDSELEYNDNMLALEDERYNERMKLAQEKVQPYIEQYRSNAEVEKEDATKGVSHVARVESGSSEAFAMINRIYDSSQKSNAQRVDNIEKYVKRMTAYLTTMAANSASDFELELNA